MRAFVIAILVLPLLCTEGVAQWSHEDDSIFTARIQVAKANHFDTLPIGERVVAVGKLFLGTPYVAGTLDTDSIAEHLIINLHGLDCVTFYENSLALARVIRKYSKPTHEDYEREITYLRYRGGKSGGERSGFERRLNYTTDYFQDNQGKGVLSIVTLKIGTSLARRDERPLNFMTQHRSLYKQLAHNDEEYEDIVEVEENIQAHDNRWYIPKEEISKIEGKIQSGDILGITTNIAGLDCSHTGIAIRRPDGRIHFMHASSLMGKVIISDEPLAIYLTHSTHQTGIIVTRPIEVEHGH